MFKKWPILYLFLGIELPTHHLLNMSLLQCDQ